MFDVYEAPAKAKVACRVNVGRPDHCNNLADFEVDGSCVHEHTAADWTPVCADHRAVLDTLVCGPCANPPDEAHKHICSIRWETRELS